MRMGYVENVGGKGIKKAVRWDCLVGCDVICTRFELVTSCLSSKRSKPTELTDHFLAICGCKSTTFFQTDKIILKKNVYLQS